MTPLDFSDFISFMYPVIGLDLPDIKDPHCTLAQLGQISDGRVERKTLERILRAAQLESPGETQVIGLEMFGDAKDIPVMLLEPSMLRVDFAVLSIVLEKLGIEETSKHSFNPHVSITYSGGLPEGFTVPQTIKLGAPELWWDNER